MQCQEYQIYCSGTFQLYVVGSNDFEERHAVSAQTSFIRARACPFLNPAFNETCFQRPPESVVYEINKQAPTITKDSKPGNFKTERTTKTKFMGVAVDLNARLKSMRVKYRHRQGAGRRVEILSGLGEEEDNADIDDDNEADGERDHVSDSDGSM